MGVEAIFATFRKLAANKGIAITNTIAVFPAAPDAFQAQIRPATGYDWSVDGLYEADNRKRGAEVSFFINKPKGQKSKIACNRNQPRLPKNNKAAAVA